jgi:hypothetical protein
MYSNIFFIFIITTVVHKSSSTLCYTCDGLITDLTNHTCSVISQNDSCYTTIGYAVDTGNWIISMGGFSETSQTPDYYIKPKSGSSFFDQFWQASNEIGNHQMFYTRVFCYEDYCNPISIIQKYINSDISYESFTVVSPVTECLICNVSNYNAAELCTKTQPGSSCYLTANQTVNDLYSYVDWSSSVSKQQKSPQVINTVIIQYEIDTQLVNSYVLIDCGFKICSTFEFMKQFLKSIKIII